MGARITNAQVMEGLGALMARLDALEGAGNTPAKASNPAPKEPDKVPFLSCWNGSRINANARGVFTHTNRKSGEARKYRRLSEAEAIELVKANIAAGRAYAVPA